MKEFPDVFAWSYEYLKVYDTGLIQHVIPIKEDKKTLQEKVEMNQPSVVVVD